MCQHEHELSTPSAKTGILETYNWQVKKLKERENLTYEIIHNFHISPTKANIAKSAEVVNEKMEISGCKTTRQRSLYYKTKLLQMSIFK